LLLVPDTLDQTALLSLPPPSPLEEILHPTAREQGVRLFCKRDDLYSLAPGTALQGNKVRKLLPILKAALTASSKPVLCSFGGAYSNPLAALATAGKRYDLPVVLFVRGEEVDNALLQDAAAKGAHLIRLSRTDYRLRNDSAWLASQQRQLAVTFDLPLNQIWMIPEGGSTAAGILNCGTAYREALSQLGAPPDYFCLSAGTGGTAAGILQATDPATRVIVFPALKGNWMAGEIRKLLPHEVTENWELISDFHFGGYGKFPKEWIIPTAGLAKRAAIDEPGLPPLEPIYSAKLFSGVLARLRAGFYRRGSKVVVLHCGGIY